jgi:hypothetical protein
MAATRVSRGGRLARVFAFVALALIAVVVYDARIHREMVDFTVWRTAAVRFVRAEPLYRDTDGHYQFKYFPGFALVMAPFGLLDQNSGKFLWFATSLVLLITLLHWSILALPERRLSYWLLVVFTVVLMAKFYAREVLLGQTNVLLGALLVAALSGIQRGHTALAGAVVGLAVFVKPYALILVPWLLVTRGVRSFAAAAAVVAMGLVAPAALYGWRGNLALLAGWFRAVTESTAPNLLNSDNVSLASTWAKWIGPGALASTLAWFTIIGTLVVVLAVWRARHRVAAPEYLECALLMLLIPLISPQGWDYVLLLATPAVVCLVDRWRELTAGWQWGLAVALTLMSFTMFDILGRALYGHFMAWSIVSVCALAISVGLWHLRRRGLA